MRAAGIDEDVFKPMGREDTRRVVSAHADGAQYDVTPRGVKLADAFGAVGYRATNIAELREALRKAQQSEGPVLIDCQIDSDDKVFPMVPAGKPIETVFDQDDLKK